VIPWSPLARGRLTRDWRQSSAREETDEVGKKLYTAAVEADRAVIDAVAAIAAARGVPRAQVALAWVLQQPGVTAPIIGASRIGHLEDGMAALALTLTPDEVAALEAPYVAHPVSGI
jgi:aryl-alcohol dehydrogenase-like predicted oxidoreductase